MAVWGCVGRLRAGSMKDVLSAPHEINVRFSDYVPYGVEKKSPAFGGRRGRRRIARFYVRDPTSRPPTKA